VTRLLTEGHEIRVLDNFSTGHRSNLDGVADDVEWIEGDVRELATVQRAARGCEAVFHLAAVPSVPRSITDPVTTHTANASGTLNVLIAARDADAGRVVFSSSSSIYGAAPGLPKRESMTPLPISPYAASKLAGESYCRSFHDVFGLETVALRYFNVFGPRQDPQSQYAAVIPLFIWSYRHGEPPVISGDGEQSRDFTYVANVVDANLLALGAAGAAGRVFNIACGQRVTLNRLAAILRAQTGARIEPVHGPARRGDIRHSLADIELARQELGYDPAVGLEEGLRQTVEHVYATELRRAPRLHVLRPIQAASEFPRSRQWPKRGEAAFSGPRFSGPRDLHASGRFLVTGGAGFIGSHLAEALLGTGRCERLVLLDDLSTGNRGHVEHLLAGGAELVEGSATDVQLVDELMRSTDICVHLASPVGVQRVVEDPLSTLTSGVQCSNVVMRAAAESGVRVLFASTSEVYGKHTNGALSEQDDLILGSPAKGRWTYAIAKSYGEALVAAYRDRHQVPGIVVRLFNTVGPRQTGSHGMVLPRLVCQALRGDDLTVYGSGAQTRCFTHVTDAVEALLLLLDSAAAPGQTFNVGSSTPIEIVELARRVIERSGSSSGIVLVPYEAAYGEGFEELGRRRPDTTALRKLTGWQPRHTIDDAIDEVIAYERRRLERDAGQVEPAPKASAMPQNGIDRAIPFRTEANVL
jgi:nucleoside-diphosphate-sugar epimerase